MRTRTHLAALGALGLFIAALVLPQETVDKFVELPLDFTGIDEVEVRSERRVAVELSRDEPFRARYPNARDSSVTTSRQGNRLLVESALPGYLDLSLRIPHTVRRLVLPSAHVSTRAKVDTLDIEVSDDLNWSGDIGSLAIVDTRRQALEAPQGTAPESAAAEAAAVARASARGCQPSCGSEFTISGDIADLHLTTRTGTVSLERSDDLGNATLVLGPGARFSISRASRMPNLTLLPLDGDGIETTEIAP